MAAKAYFLFSVDNLAAGATFNFTWKNIPPATAYRLDATPYDTGYGYAGSISISQVEVTRFWRRTRVEVGLPEGPGGDFHHDVLGTIKNVGNEAIYLNAYLIAVT
jgi:hypothetical protein